MCNSAAMACFQHIKFKAADLESIRGFDSEVKLRRGRLAGSDSYYMRLMSGVVIS